MDRYLDFNSNHPKSAKRAVVRALTDRTKNVCLSPELLAEEMDHLGKVLRYNNYPKWMIKQGGRSNSPAQRLIDLETADEVKKTVIISALYFPGLSEPFKQLFKYTHIQVCFKSQNTFKSMLMYPKYKVNPSLKNHIVYQWSCTNPSCKSYIGETPRSLCEHVKEHSKEGSNSAIYQHCYTKGHPLPNVDQFKVIDQEKSQIAPEAKEAIHICKEDPELNRNVGKMVILQVFDPILGIKPKNPNTSSLLSQESQLELKGLGT